VAIDQRGVMSSPIGLCGDHVPAAPVNGHRGWRLTVTTHRCAPPSAPAAAAHGKRTPASAAAAARRRLPRPPVDVLAAVLLTAAARVGTRRAEHLHAQLLQAAPRE